MYTFKRLFLFVAFMSLGACSFPVSLNLLDVFPDAAEGRFTFTTPSGRVNLLPNLSAPQDTVSLPNVPISVGGISFPEIVTALPVEIDVPEAALTAAEVSYAVELEAVGELSGTFTLQPYLAPQGVNNVASSAYALGEAQSLTLPNAQTLQATLSLNAEQLRGVNEGALQFAFGVAGRNVSVGQGEVGVRYAVTQLEVEATEVRVDVNEFLPQEAGEKLDFSDQDVPPRAEAYGIDYRLTLTPDASVTGELTAQLYLAPPLAEGQDDADDPLFSERYAFGEAQTLALGQDQVTLEDAAAFNEAQEQILETEQLRVGVRLTGTATVPLGSEVGLDYAFTRLELSGGYRIF